MQRTISRERLEARLQRAESLLQLKELLTSTLDTAEVYRRAARAFTESFEVRRCAISSWEREANTVTTQAEFVYDVPNNIINEYDTEYEVYNLDTHADSFHLLQNHQPIIRFAEDPNLEEAERNLLVQMKMAYSLEVPLVYQDVTIGLVELYRGENQHIFNKEEIEFAQAMSTQVAGALHNAQITTDANRRAAELSMLNRLSTAFSLSPTLTKVYQDLNLEISLLFEVTKTALFLFDTEDSAPKLAFCFQDEIEVDPTTFQPSTLDHSLIAQVLKTRKRALIHGGEQNRYLNTFNPDFKVVGIGVALPLIVAEKMLGVLVLENEYDSSAVTEQDLSFLDTIMGPLATTVSRLIQFEALQAALENQSQQRIQLQTAAAVAAATTDILELEELVQQAVNIIKEQFNLYYTGLFLIDPETNFAVLRAGTGEAGRQQVSLNHQLHVGGRSLIGGATFDNVPRIIQDVQLDKEWRPNPHLPNTRSELALPLRVRGQTIGALTVQSISPNHFNDDLLATLLALADQLAVAIENAQLINQAEARAARQQRLNQISTVLHSSSDVNTIIAHGLKALSEHIGHQNVELVLGNS
ncbi:MAG: GAF domain-containing protein [Chloroflexota bacterium]